MLIILLYPGSLSDQRAKGRVAVKRPGGEAGDLLDGLADADADPRQDLPDLLVGIRAVAGHDQRGQTVHHEPQIAEIQIRFQFCDLVDLHQRRPDERLQMLHRLHRAPALPLRPREKQQPVELRLLPREADILHSDAEEGDLLLQARVRISVVHAHGGGADLLPDGVHRAEGREDRLRGRAERVRHRLRGQPLDPLRPDDLQRGCH